MSNIPQGSNSGNGIYLTKAQALALFATPAYVHALTDGSFVSLTGSTMSGPLIINPGADSTNVLSVLNHSVGATLFKVDTTNNIVYGPSGATIMDTHGYCKPNGLLVASNDYYNGWFQDTGGNNYLHIDGSTKKITASIDTLIQADFGGSDSTTKFQIKNKSGTSLFNVDTTNSIITTTYNQLGDGNGNAYFLSNNNSTTAFLLKNSSANYLTANASNGAILLNSTTNNTAAFDLKRSGGISIFRVDTSTPSVIITPQGGAANSTTVFNILDVNSKSILSVNNTATNPGLKLGGSASGPTSSTMFQVLDGSASPKPVFTIDTTTNGITIGSSTTGGPTSLTAFVVYNGSAQSLMTISSNNSTISFSSNVSVVFLATFNTVSILPRSGLSNLFDIGSNSLRYLNFYGNNLDLKTATNTTTAVNVANSAGTSILSVDTTNGGSLLVTGSGVSQFSGPLSVISTNSTYKFTVANSVGTNIFTVDTVNSLVKVNGNPINSFAKTTVQYSTSSPFTFHSGSASYLACGLSATGLTKPSITITGGGNVVVKISGYADFNAWSAAGFFNMQIQNVANNTSQGASIGLNNALATWTDSANGTNNNFASFEISQKFTGYTLASTQYFDLILSTVVNTSIVLYVNYVEVSEVP
jgi:hypothetical protein